MQRSEQINELATALAAAQLEMKSAFKGNTNPHFKSKYAALPDVIEVAKVLNKHGLSYVQPTRAADDGSVIIETVLLHKSGQWLSGELLLRPQQNTPQGIGSALTYGRRYGLSSLVGIASDDDDDGNAASTSNGKKDLPSISAEDVGKTVAEWKREIEAAPTKADLDKVSLRIAAAKEHGCITEPQALELSPAWVAKSKSFRPVAKQ